MPAMAPTRVVCRQPRYRVTGEHQCRAVIRREPVRRSSGASSAETTIRSGTRHAGSSTRTTDRWSRHSRGRLVSTRQTPMRSPSLRSRTPSDGLPLDSYVRAKLVPLLDRLGIFLRICDAVRHAHECRVVHLDLKPSNIVVDPSGSPHVIDFGIAQCLGDPARWRRRRQGLADGIGFTPAYAAPEQVSSSPAIIDRRTDVYAMGVILYELLTGVLPYHQGTPRKSLIDHIRTSKPVRPSRLNRAVDRRLDGVVLKALSKSPADRQASAAELYAEIDQR